LNCFLWIFKALILWPRVDGGTPSLASGFSKERIAKIHHAYRILLNSKRNTAQALEALRAEGDQGEDVARLIKFIEQSERGVIKR